MSIETLYVRLVIEYLPYGGLDRQPDDIRYIFSVMLPDADHIKDAFHLHAAGDIRCLKALFNCAPHRVPMDILKTVTSPAKADIFMRLHWSDDDLMKALNYKATIGDRLMTKYYASKLNVKNVAIAL